MTRGRLTRAAWLTVVAPWLANELAGFTQGQTPAVAGSTLLAAASFLASLGAEIRATATDTVRPVDATLWIRNVELHPAREIS